MDAVIVCMGDNVSQSIITTLLLKEIGVSHIIAKANDQHYGRVLKKIGAGTGQVIYPEQEVAIREAVPEKFTVLPTAEFRIKDSDVLVLLGKASDISRLEKKAGKAEQ